MKVITTQKSSKAYLELTRTIRTMMRFDYLQIRVGVVKGKPYPNKPSANVARVAGVLEKKTRWMSRAFDENKGSWEEIQDEVLAAAVRPEEHDVKTVRKACRGFQKVMRNMLDSLGLVDTGFLRKNVKYQVKNWNKVFRLQRAGRV